MLLGEKIIFEEVGRQPNFLLQESQKSGFFTSSILDGGVVGAVRVSPLSRIVASVLPISTLPEKTSPCYK